MGTIVYICSCLRSSSFFRTVAAISSAFSGNRCNIPFCHASATAAILATVSASCFGACISSAHGDKTRTSTAAIASVSPLYFIPRSRCEFIRDSIYSSARPAISTASVYNRSARTSSGAEPQKCSCTTSLSIVLTSIGSGSRCLHASKSAGPNNKWIGFSWCYCFVCLYHVTASSASTNSECSVGDIGREVSAATSTAEKNNMYFWVNIIRKLYLLRGCKRPELQQFILAFDEVCKVVNLVPVLIQHGFDVERIICICNRVLLIKPQGGCIACHQISSSTEKSKSYMW